MDTDIGKKQTPAHDGFNPDLLALMPKECKRVVEVGCSTGALARAYLAINPGCEYIGLEIDDDYAATAAKVCSRVITGDVETMTEDTLESLFPCDCVVFGDSLEHLERSVDSLAASAHLNAACGTNHCLHSECTTLERAGKAELW